jgi:hypothetical protein
LDIRRKRVSSSTKFGDCHFGHLPSHSMRRSVYDMAVGIWRQSTFDGKAFGKAAINVRRQSVWKIDFGPPVRANIK